MTRNLLKDILQTYEIYGSPIDNPLEHIKSIKGTCVGLVLTFFITLGCCPNFFITLKKACSQAKAHVYFFLHIFRYFSLTELTKSKMLTTKKILKLRFLPSQMAKNLGAGWFLCPKKKLVFHIEFYVCVISPQKISQNTHFLPFYFL